MRTALLKFLHVFYAFFINNKPAHFGVLKQIPRKLNSKHRIMKKNNTKLISNKCI